MIHVYDYELNFITSFGWFTFTNSKSILFDYNLHLILINCENYFMIFDYFSFKICGKVETRILGKKMHLMDSVLINYSYPYNSGYLEYYGFVYNNHIKARSNAISEVYSTFICKLNDFDHHLFNEPYFLPCCNSSACLQCICYSYFIELAIL